MAMSRSQMSKQISKPPMKKGDMPRGLTYYKKGGKASRKSKGSKICPEGKAWAQRTFDTYNDVDSFHYSGIHDEIKMIKHGYGKVSDHVAREIRLKRMTYEEGVDKVNSYKSKKPKDLKL